ncbi:metal-sulfur cluster assembly factor [Corynebacterium caspium]|uniref:metal-sulfur cluster assembly factor n=1 Tax=Corynebacterium caspium TaxID=234828 RepID=UPI000360B5DD|nr:metal-sulfur cluster assembly factor [Corynebacterium caspium]WKD59270.1 hypothetical protein CCASP_04365 [Corynebacterium caspium DSM 44850]
MTESENSNGTNSFDSLDAQERPEQSPEDISAAADAKEYMYDVIDPELGINVVDLGLLYDIWIEHPEAGIKRAVINMTLTTPACPLTDVLEEQIQAAIVNNGVADEVHVNWVWMPPWGPHMITDDGREQLRALGFAV